MSENASALATAHVHGTSHGEPSAAVLLPEELPPVGNTDSHHAANEFGSSAAAIAGMQDVLGCSALRHVVLDTESTGLDPKRSRIVEIAVVEFDPATGTTGQHFHTLVNPGCPIPAECTAIHGISDQDVAGAPKFKDVLPQLAAFLDGTACVIHNANYDTALLTAELQRLKTKAFGNMVCVVIDTLKIARQVLPGRKHKLDSLCDHYSVDRSARSVHGALIDCALLAAIYPHLRGNLEELAESLSTRLPFRFGEPIPDSVEGCAMRWLQLNDLRDLIDKEQKRIHERAKERAAGSNVEGSNWIAEFKPKLNTDWDKVTQAFLAGVDLTPFKKPSIEFRIRWKSD